MYGDTDFDKAKAYSAQVAAAQAAAAGGQQTTPSDRRDRRLQTVTDITAILQSFLPASQTQLPAEFQPSTVSQGATAPTTPWGTYAVVGVGVAALIGGVVYFARRR